MSPFPRIPGPIWVLFTGLGSFLLAFLWSGSFHTHCTVSLSGGRGTTGSNLLWAPVQSRTGAEFRLHCLRLCQMDLKNPRAHQFPTHYGWLVPVLDYPRVLSSLTKYLMRDVLSASFHSTPELWALSWQGNPAMSRNVTQVSGLLSSPENCSAVKWQRAEGIWRERIFKF